MKPVLRKLKLLLWLAVIAFIAVYLSHNARDVLFYGYDFHWLYIPASLLFVVLAYLLNIGIWVTIASHYGARTSWLTHACIWSTSRLGRYVPGKLAAIYLRIDGYDAGQRGRAGISLYIETASSLIAVCTFLLVFALAGLVAMNALHLALITGALTLLLVLSSGPFLRSFFNRVDFLKGLSPPQTRADGRLLAKVTLLQIVVMTLHGISLLLAVRTFTGIGISALVEITVFYYFAGLVGMLSLFAPAGLGVREAVLTGLLQALIPMPAAIAAVALIRLITVAAELLISGTFVLLSRRTSQVNMP